MDLSALVPETPAILIDRQKARNNCLTAAASIQCHGVNWRPHTKTHKMVEFALMQIECGAFGICCAKISEAEVMADGGIDDIFIAYPLVGDFRIARAVDLARKIRLILTVDSAYGARALSRYAVQEGVQFEIRMEIDTQFRRTGVKREDAVELAKIIAALPGLDLSGIATFRSMTLDGAPTRDARSAGVQEGEMLVATAAEIRQAGIDIREVSGGSTPTGHYVATVPGITEVRTGTNIFHDYNTYLNGACTLKEIAACLIFTVVSTPDPGYAVVDGGSKAFATDFPVKNPDGTLEFAFGLADNLFVLNRLYEEHGIVVNRNGPTGLQVGDRIAMVPAHICSSINLFNYLYIYEDGKVRKADVDARGMLV